jgi:GNAT superfamily N-acetyltransferase
MQPNDIIIEEIPLDSPKLKEFVQFPWELYRKDPCWTPPLNADLLGNKLLGIKGILTSRHPYHRSAEVTHFLARKNGSTVGRISAAVNHEYNDYHKTKIGSFGFFETIEDYEVAKALLDKARDWVKRRDMHVMRGPGEYSNATHERQGILIDGFEYPPTVELTHNPPYYQHFLEKYGFVKAKDYLAHKIIVTEELLARAVPFAKRLARKVSPDVTTRRIDLKNLKSEVSVIVDIYNQAWSHNWGFLPLTNDDADVIANSLSIIADADIIYFAYIGKKPIAVMGNIPDPFYALRPRWKWYGDSDLVRLTRLLLIRRNIPRVRSMFFGIIPEYQGTGIPTLLIMDVAKGMLKNNYKIMEASLLLEDNSKIINFIELFDGEKYKVWRIYDLPLK